jgi:hypothetical protein
MKLGRTVSLGFVVCVVIGAGVYGSVPTGAAAPIIQTSVPVPVVAHGSGACAITNLSSQDRYITVQILLQNVGVIVEQTDLLIPADGLQNVGYTSPFDTGVVYIRCRFIVDNPKVYRASVSSFDPTETPVTTVAVM